MSFLGIDIGSSQVKAVVFDHTGRELASAYEKYRYSTPRPGWMELDSRQVLSGAWKVIVQCAQTTAHTDPVQALSISSQGEAFTPVSSQGKPLAPAMISGDSRAAGEMAAFAGHFGTDKIYQITGHTPSGMFSLAKFLWLKRFHPDIRKKAAKFLCFEDLLIFTLTGEAAMGYPLAGRTLLFDGKTHQWSGELLDAAGIKEAELARPFLSGEVVGVLKREVAEELHLSPGVVVVGGGHDQVIGALGCGAVESGSAMYAAGSVECIVPVSDRRILSRSLCSHNLCTYDFALPGKYASVAYSLTGSNLLDYFLQEYGRELRGDYTALLDSMPEEPTSILTLPYFTASGTPYFDSQTPGCVYGWRLDTARGTLLKGLQEGIALEMKLNFELLQQSGMELNRLIASGGGFRHRAMVQLRADVLNLPISVTGVREAGCRGAALLAQGGFEKRPLCAALPAVAEVLPDPARAAAYQKKFEVWKDFCKNIRGKDLWQLSV